MLIKCIQNLHEWPSFGIAHYKNQEKVQNINQLKASNLTLVYSSPVIDSGGSFRKQFITVSHNLVLSPLLTQMPQFYTIDISRH